MPDTADTTSPEQPAAASAGFADADEFTAAIEEMVADQTPRVFAVVLEFGEHIDAQIVSWGMVIDEQNTYVATVDGKSQFLLTAPENALKYVRRLPGVTSHIVWAPHRR